MRYICNVGERAYLIEQHALYYQFSMYLYTKKENNDIDYWTGFNRSFIAHYSLLVYSIYYSILTVHYYEYRWYILYCRCTLNTDWEMKWKCPQNLLLVYSIYYSILTRLTVQVFYHVQISTNHFSTNIRNFEITTKRFISIGFHIVYTIANHYLFPHFLYYKYTEFIDTNQMKNDDGTYTISYTGQTARWGKLSHCK